MKVILECDMEVDFIVCFRGAFPNMQRFCRVHFRLIRLNGWAIKAIGLSAYFYIICLAFFGGSALFGQIAFISLFFFFF